MLFDVHAHLTHETLSSQIEAVIARAADAGLGTIICNGLNPSDNQCVLELAERFPMIRPALGWYPVDAVLQSMRAAGEDYPDQREAWSADDAIGYVERNLDRAFAVGEIGLDGYWVKEPFWQEQEQAFRRLVRLAMDADKVVIIHTRKRERRALEVLLEMGCKRVNWHCFGGKVNLARTIAEQGHYLSIPANARRSESFTRMIQTLPREQILLETDCPYLGPERDKTNEPMNVRGTAEYAAELWGTELGATERLLAENFARLFGVEP
ncbi:MAG TPA: TatD family hydrolase [Polyangiaceae bacterium]|jgi:TatD DNase family protein|nr:TatD family hydrolase [Polyangiaceae bacterium]